MTHTPLTPTVPSIADYVTAIIFSRKPTLLYSTRSFTFPLPSPMAPIPPPINRSLFLALSSLLLILFFSISNARSSPWDSAIRMPSEEADAEEIGTRWAVLVAGSSGYENYRHQADVCHAYQILKKGGLKEENIVVFMFDDIAASPFNPRPGVIINNPNGSDVYAGVPKDYTGNDVNAKNLYAVLLGKKEEVEGGSGKVVASGPNDRIFIYYSDHGGPGVLGMPNMPFLYANNFIDVLKKKHASGGYKEMVIYVEACESGSLFEGLMPDDINTYVTTASNAEESSWGTYCPGMNPAPPSEYTTCLGDLYSVAWMEDSESHDLRKETIKQQYEAVKDRTSNYNTYNAGSHVMEYGNKSIKSEDLYLYQGFDPSSKSITQNTPTPYTNMEAINQRDADLLFMWNRYKQLEDGSENKVKILKEFMEILTHRMHLDSSVEDIGGFLFGPQGPSILKAKRPLGRALVDDWGCLKAMVRVFETHCGSLTQYGMKHMRAFANICNKGIPKDQMEVASKKACSGYIVGSWSVSSRGHSA